MAFFKFRKNAGDSSATPTQPDSVEVMRKRAKHRLIGAAVLVLVGVIGFPLLFDNQPRPIAVDIPIEIPDKNKVKPLVVPAVPAPSIAVASAPAKPVAVAPATVPEAAAPVEKPPKPAVAASEAPVVAKKSEPKPVETPAAVKPTESAKAKALLEGKDVVAKEPAAADGRFVVQVGAFADVAKAREARLKVEKAGLKTYTQVVETKDGRRIRVRVGPFAGRTEADQAAEKIKKLDLSAAVLTL
ncbi:MAG TPA: SPOR domain-containing protein [Burkholderiaceae bacterium]|nr:SPOR domain-containing protein [Burkholderiaceae bacterium]